MVAEAQAVEGAARKIAQMCAEAVDNSGAVAIQPQMSS
jgi:hypothetical protein